MKMGCFTEENGAAWGRWNMNAVAPSLPSRPRGFTIIELLIVVSIIAFLIAALFAGLMRLRERTAISKTRTLLEKVRSGLETYKLHFQVYPPDINGSMTGSEALYYYLTTAFNRSPDPKKNEVAATVNAGPLAQFEENEVKAGQIVDAWGSPLHYARIQRDDPSKSIKQTYVNVANVMELSAEQRQLQKIWSAELYAWGTNRKDDGGSGDDLQVGGQ